RLATGRLPFSGGGVTRVLLAHRDTPPGPPREGKPPGSEARSEAIPRAPAQRREDRFPHAHPLPPAPPPAPTPPPAPPTRRARPPGPAHAGAPRSAPARHPRARAVQPGASSGDVPGHAPPRGGGPAGGPPRPVARGRLRLRPRAAARALHPGAGLARASTG